MKWPPLSLAPCSIYRPNASWERRSSRCDIGGASRGSQQARFPRGRHSIRSACNRSRSSWLGRKALGCRLLPREPNLRASSVAACSVKSMKLVLARDPSGWRWLLADLRFLLLASPQLQRRAHVTRRLAASSTHRVELTAELPLIRWHLIGARSSSALSSRAAASFSSAFAGGLSHRRCCRQCSCTHLTHGWRNTLNLSSV